MNIFSPNTDLIKRLITQSKTVDHLNELLRAILALPHDQTVRFSSADVAQILKICEVFWTHSGNPADPHAELTSGKCSNGFADVLKALCNPLVCSALARDLAFLLASDLPKHQLIWVIGSDHAGASFSKDVANHLAMLGFRIKHEFAEKGPEVDIGGGLKEKTQIWKRHEIGPEDLVLNIEELITTTATLKAVRDAIRKAHAYPIRFHKVAGVLVHRSNVDRFDDSDILYSLHLDIETWDPSECPFCKAGSKRLKPKIPEQWAELTGKTASVHA